MASSTKYLCLPAGVLLPIVYFSKDKRLNHFIFGLILILIFFLIGTPYALLDYKTFFYEMRGIALGPEAGLKRNLVYGFLKTFQDWIFMGNKTPVIGLIMFY